MALNRIVLQGRLTRDPEIRTAGDKKVANFSLAVDRDIKDKDGNRGTDFINVVAWRPAEFVEKFFKKGDMMVVDGRLQVRSYTDKDNNKRTAYEVNADNVYFGGAKGDSTTSDEESKADSKQTSQPATAAESDDADEDGELPF